MAVLLRILLAARAAVAAVRYAWQATAAASDPAEQPIVSFCGPFDSPGAARWAQWGMAQAIVRRVEHPRQATAMQWLRRN